jgi:predicted aspartyl protease
MIDRTFGRVIPYGTRRGKKSPTVPVTFTYLRTTRQYLGLVDSGSERSACSASIAREAGLDLSSFPERAVLGAGGISRARLRPIDVNILGHRLAIEILVIDLPDSVLLGRHDVFRAFQFAFDERAEVLLVEPY